jgi:hypothetical protein
MVRPALSAALAVALIACGAPAAAQPFRSDDAGPILTGSGVAGAGYPGAAFRDLRDALFRRVGARTAFRTVAVADAVLSAAAELGDAVCRGAAPPPREWPRPLDLDAPAQRRLCHVLGDPLAAGDATALVEALTGGWSGAHGEAAGDLVESLAGLLGRERETLDERGRWVEAEAWERALTAYERYLSIAPAALLESPPHELVVLGSVLQRVVAAGLAASGR